MDIEYSFPSTFVILTSVSKTEVDPRRITADLWKLDLKLSDYLIMPLFSCSHFKLRKAPLREARFRPAESSHKVGHDSCEDIKVNLGQLTSNFHNGDWHNDLPHNRNDLDHELVSLRATKSKLEEQLYLLRVKNEILLDTVVIQKSKINQLESENSSLRDIFNKSKARFES